MDMKLQRQLFKRFPKLFTQRKLPMSQTCMCWLFECGDGWYNIINDLCHNLQGINADIEFSQIKEKFGTLRVYYDNNGEYDTSNVDELIDYAEKASEDTCEYCGSMVGVTQTDGWIVTLCKDCMKKYKARLR